MIFVEGHSTDGTWEEIERVREKWDGQSGLRVRALRQTGSGKSDAVRLGFSEASGEILTILDADLTMPPEVLTRFYEAYCEGLADFVNGTRLVYPMEGEAMRFLNHLGNVFFAKSLSYVLDMPLGDSLCGTKLVSRARLRAFRAVAARLRRVRSIRRFRAAVPGRRARARRDRHSGVLPCAHLWIDEHPTIPRRRDAAEDGGNRTGSYPMWQAASQNG